MEVSYNNKTKTITITDIGSLVNPVLVIDGVEVQDLSTDNTYTFTSDGIYNLSVNSDLSTEELGYYLIIDYSKDKNRLILLSVLDNRTFYAIPELYIKNNKIIGEIEFSFYSGNLDRPLLLMKELNFGKLC